MMKPGILGGAALVILGLSGCYKAINLEKNPIPGNTLCLEFAAPVKFVLDLKVDGKVVPVKYSGRNRRLWIEGLKPGTHNFNIHSVSYVFGPEFESFKVDAEKGAYYYIQLRRYRSAIPKDKARVSIRAYRRKLRKGNIEIDQSVKNLRAFFK